MKTLDINDKTNLLAIETQCPVCGDQYLYGVPYVHVPCKKCGTAYKTDFRQDPYTKIARRINSILSWENGLVLNVSDRYESAIVHIKEHFTRFNNWDVSDITQETKEFKFCRQCGICKECYTCKDCGEKFKPDKNRRKQKCSNCESQNLQKTHFTEAKESKCPHCGSKKVKFTITPNKTKCHKCSSTKLSDKQEERTFQLTIKRKKGYMIEDV